MFAKQLNKFTSKLPSINKQFTYQQQFQMKSINLIKTTQFPLLTSNRTIRTTISPFITPQQYSKSYSQLISNNTIYSTSTRNMIIRRGAPTQTTKSTTQPQQQQQVIQQQATYEYQQYGNQPPHIQQHTSTTAYQYPPQQGPAVGSQIYHMETLQHKYPMVPQQQQQQLKWYQQPSQNMQPPNEFFMKHPILYQIFQTMLFVIGVTFAYSIFR